MSAARCHCFDLADETASYYGPCGINFENVIIYSKWRLAVQNICSNKITKLANMWEEMEVFVKNWPWTVLHSVAMVTVKTS